MRVGRVLRGPAYSAISANSALLVSYFRFGTFSSPSFATMSCPDVAGLTALSMNAILPAGSM